MHPIVDQIIQLESAQIGYIETPENRTKFARELDSVEKPKIGREGVPWCGTFQDWAFYRCQAIAALAFRNYGTVSAAKQYMRLGRWYADPEVGDLAFLHNSGAVGHVGIVVEVGLHTVVTIEGNTTSGSVGDQRNGGMVARRVRARKWWAGYGRPDYGKIIMPGPDWAAIAMVIEGYRAQVLQQGSKGDAVAYLQRLLGVPDDGDFGPRTEQALKVRQYLFVQHQINDLHIPNGSMFLLAITGVCEAHTWAALLDTA